MKHIFYICMMILTAFNSASCQSIKLSTIDKKFVYQPSDTLVVKISNQTKDSIRYYFGLECYFENRWVEIDNDIFRNVPKENHFFGLSASSLKRHDIPISSFDIDSLFTNGKFRLIVNALPIN